MKCRACESTALSKVFDLGHQPLANEFLKESTKEKFPLEVLLCEGCLLAQLSVVVPPERLYSTYHFVTNSGPTIYNHARQLYCDLTQTFGAPRTVIEVGSNNGTTLDLWQKFGVRNVLGIEPAQNVHAIAIEAGIPTIRGWLSPLTAVQVKAVYPRPDIILLRHVFCHIANWREAIDSLAMMATDQTTVAIEVPYVPDMLDKVQFDTIYHEHLSYMTVSAMMALVENSPFTLAGVIRYSLHGGVIVLLLRKRSACYQIPVEIHERLKLEQLEAGHEAWKTFSARAFQAAHELDSFVRNNPSKSFCCYGASAKSTVMLNLCRFTSRQIGFITDTTPSKQGCVSPGSDIPIVHPKELTERQPDYAILSAWNYEREIVKREVEFQRKGGRFIVPIPTMRIVE